MKKSSLLNWLVDRFFILFNLTEPYGRPSKEKESSVHMVKALVLPNKQTIMLDEFSGFTKAKILIQDVYEGNLVKHTIVEVCEPYFEGYYCGKKCLMVHENYEPLVVGETYTFLLTKEDQIFALSEEEDESDEITYYKELEHKVS